MTDCQADQEQPDKIAPDRARPGTAVAAQSIFERMHRRRIEPPYSAEVEQALLGVALRNPKFFDLIPDTLQHWHFYVPEHAVLFREMRRLADAGREISPAVLSGFAAREPILAEMEGGADSLLYELAANIVTVMNVADYARTIIDLSLARDLIGLSRLTEDEALRVQAADETAAEVLSRLESRLLDLTTGAAVRSGARDLGTVLDETLRLVQTAMQHDGSVLGVETGFHRLDTLTSGMGDGDLVILAGRPSMGKSTLAYNIGFHVGRTLAARFETDVTGNVSSDATGKRGCVLIFTQEMSDLQLAKKCLSAMAGLPTQAMDRGSLRADQFDRMAVAARDAARWPVWLDDTPGATVAHMRMEARRRSRTAGPVRLIVVDYLQIMGGGDGSDRGGPNRVEMIGRITRGLKDLAKEMRCPVLLLSQLSRKVEEREDKRPALADLRDSGSIEQDADQVWFVYRPEYYLTRAGEPAKRANEAEGKFMDRWNTYQEQLREEEGRALVIVAKQRMGPIGDIVLRFDGAASRFSNWE